MWVKSGNLNPLPTWLDPGRDFWRSLRHRDEAPPAGLSACETFRACPDYGGGVGAVEDAPSDASSAVDLPPPSGTTNDDDSATYVLVLSITSIESLVGFREFWIVMCPWRVLITNKRHLLSNETFSLYAQTDGNFCRRRSEQQLERPRSL